MPTSTPTPAPLAVSVLSLLAERDMHPYEMIQTLRERREDRWVKLRPSSLYHQVERLVATGSAEVSGVNRAGNRPERTVYTITASGRQALTRWIDENLTTPVPPYDPFSLALGECATLSPEHVRSALAERVARLDATIAELRTDLRGVDPGRRHWLLAHEHMLTMQQTEREYVLRLLADLDSKELSWPTP